MVNRHNLQNIENILIFHPAGIGDAVLSVPVIKAIREAYPEAYIALVTSSRAKTLVELCPYIDELFAIEMDEISNALNPFNGEKLTNVWRLVSELRSRRFDVIADFTRIGSRFNAVKRAVLFNLIQGKRIVGRNTRGWGFFLHGKVFDPDEEHEVEHLMNVAKLLGTEQLQRLGQTQGLLELELFLSDDDRTHVKSFFEENGVSNERPVVGINPNAFWTSKRWMEERFASVADRLTSYHDAVVILVGSRGDIPLVEKIRSQMKSSSINAAGKTSLRQLGALLEKLDLFITNDSGPMHIATAAKTPIIALFGPEKPVRYDPYCAEDMKIVFWKGVKCSPCLKIECSDPKCLKSITVEEVLTGAERLLSRGDWNDDGRQRV